MTKKIRLKKSDLARLSEDELYQIAEKMKKVEESQQQNKLKDYLKTAHDKQLAFHKAQNRVRLFLGGNRSGKTTAGVVEILWTLLGIHPYRDNRTPKKGILIAQDFQTHVKDILIPKILEWSPPDIFSNIEKNQQGVPVKFIFKNGSVLDIKSQDQEMKVFEGSNYDIAWADEPLPQNIYTAVFRGLTDSGGPFYLTGTPLTFAWIADLFSKAEQGQNKGLYWAEFVHSEENVTNLGEGDAAKGKKRLMEFADQLPSEEREARLSGKFLYLAGVIFKEWKRSLHVINEFKWPSNWPIWVSIDPAQAKPWAVSWMGFTPNGTRILLRSDLVEGVIEDLALYMLNTRDEILMETPNTKPYIQKVIIDNAANVRSMERRNTTITEEINNMITPIFPRIESGPKDVIQKINIFKQWLKPQETDKGLVPSFLVFDGLNDRFIHEIERYTWKRTKSKNGNELLDRPVKKDDDIIDTVLQVALIIGSREVAKLSEIKPIRYLRG